MRGRIVFPIRDENNRLVAFAGRTTQTITDENRSYTPKYVNSQTSDLYNKSRTLYGLHLAGSPYGQRPLPSWPRLQDTLAMVAAGLRTPLPARRRLYRRSCRTAEALHQTRSRTDGCRRPRSRDSSRAIAVLHRHGMQTSELRLLHPAKIPIPCSAAWENTPAPSLQNPNLPGICKRTGKY